MPVVGMHMSESPSYPLQGQTTRDLGILVNVFLIVIVHELMLEGLTKNDPDKRQQQETNNKSADPAFIRARRSSKMDISLRSLIPPSGFSHSTKRLDPNQIGLTGFTGLGGKLI